MNLDDKNPWASLVRPDKDGEISAIRVDPSSSWDFYWSLSHKSHPQLTLLHDQQRTEKLPAFDGFKVTSVLNSDGRQILSFTLEDEPSREIFHTLCIDLVSATRNCKQEIDAVKESINRAWNWHRLLKGRHDARLSHNEQQGLMGELYIIREAIKVMNPDDVVASWKAPEENAKDFIHAAQAIEVKSRRSAHSSSVRITSSEQLDTQDFKHVVLAVVTLTLSKNPGFDLHAYAAVISSELEQQSPAAAAHFKQKIVQRGLWPEHEYIEDLWSFTNVDFYEVLGNFPRIQYSALSSGVSSVMYSIDLNAIKPFEIEEGNAFDLVYLRKGNYET